MKWKVVLGAMLACGAAHAQSPTNAEIAEQRIKTEPKLAAQALGAAVCAAKQMRKHTLEQLAKEDRYDRQTGTTNFEKRKEYRANLAEADNAERAAILEAKRMRLKISDCAKNAYMFNIAQCLLDPHGERCDEPIYAGMVSYLRHTAVWATEVE